MKNTGKFYNFELKEEGEKSFYERMRPEDIDLTLANLTLKSKKEVKQEPAGVLGFIRQLFNI